MVDMSTVWNHLPEMKNSMGETYTPGLITLSHEDDRLLVLLPYYDNIRWSMQDKNGQELASGTCLPKFIPEYVQAFDEGLKMPLSIMDYLVRKLNIEEDDYFLQGFIWGWCSTNDYHLIPPRPLIRLEVTWIFKQFRHDLGSAFGEDFVAKLLHEH